MPPGSETDTAAVIGLDGIQSISKQGQYGTVQCQCVDLFGGSSGMSIDKNKLTKRPFGEVLYCTNPPFSRKSESSGKIMTQSGEGTFGGS